jgi:hypothetical protein
MTNKIKLSSEQSERVSTYESSISHWSSEYTISVLKSQKMLDGVNSLYSSRQKYLNQILTDAGVDVTKISDLQVNDAGELTYSLNS